jgi:tripartite-type tricarboxylate transporter receptor subunit TctC
VSVFRPILKTVLSACAAAAVGLTPIAASLAKTAYPDRPVTIVVPFPPGGVTDMVSRTLAEFLAKNTGQPFIVENRPGAGTTLGANLVAKAKPDGYTLLLGVIHHTIASSVYKSLPYDFDTDLAPISTVATVGSALTINPTATPVNNLKELVALAGKEKRHLTYGSNGNGDLPPDLVRHRHRVQG